MPATDKALRATLNLPKTAFPMRANAAKREPAVVTRLTTALYQRQQAQRGSDPKPFVLHDGPPYANGALHMGHFVNRTLKDVNCRFQLLQGKRVDYVPGWDCHGLPIELKALASAAADATPQEVRFMAFVAWWHNRSFPPHSAESNHKKPQHTDDTSTESPALDPIHVRTLARDFAHQAIKEQRQDLQRWGVMADWSGAPGTIYRTLDKAYEAAELGTSTVPKKERKKLPVQHTLHSHTCINCRRCVSRAGQVGVCVPWQEAGVLVSLVRHGARRGRAGVHCTLVPAAAAPRHRSCALLTPSHLYRMTMYRQPST